MTYIKADMVLSPKAKWKLEKVFYDAGPGKIAIASGQWEGDDVLAIRWNGTDDQGKRLGVPNTFGYPTWFILPDELKSIIMSSLKIESLWDSEYIDYHSVKAAIEELAETKNHNFTWLESVKEDYQNTTFYCFKLVLGGGPKPPLERFLDLVRRVHKKNQDNVKEVIITDPYILADIGESGTNGGYTNLCSYLEAVGIKTPDKFTLTYTPSPKRSENRLPLFMKAIESVYPGVTFRTYKAQLVFHDRIYLVRDTKSKIKGVFGPSINGLNANDFVLMGEIEDESLRQLSKVFM